MVLVPLHKLFDGPLVICQSFCLHVLAIEELGVPRAHSGHDEIHHEVEHADRGCFVYHYQSFAIGHLHKLFGVGVVGRSNRIRPDPIQQLKIAEHDYRIIASPAVLAIFVFAESFKVERLPVYEKLTAGH